MGKAGKKQRKQRKQRKREPIQLKGRLGKAANLRSACEALSEDQVFLRYCHDWNTTSGELVSALEGSLTPAQLTSLGPDSREYFSIAKRFLGALPQPAPQNLCALSNSLRQRFRINNLHRSVRKHLANYCGLGWNEQQIDTFLKSIPIIEVSQAAPGMVYPQEGVQYAESADHLKRWQPYCQYLAKHPPDARKKLPLYDVLDFTRFNHILEPEESAIYVKAGSDELVMMVLRNLSMVGLDLPPECKSSSSPNPSTNFPPGTAEYHRSDVAMSDGERIGDQIQSGGPFRHAMDCGFLDDNDEDQAQSDTSDDSLPNNKEPQFPNTALAPSRQFSMNLDSRLRSSHYLLRTIDQLLSALTSAACDIASAKKGVRLEDPGIVVIMGYSCGPVSGPMLDWAKNLRSPGADPSTIMDLNRRMSSLCGFFWNLLKSKARREVIDAFNKTTSALGNLRMDGNRTMDSKYEVEIGGGRKIQFKTGELAPPVGYASINYARHTHCELNVIPWVCSWTLYRTPETDEGGKFYDAEYGVLVKPASDSMTIHHAYHLHGTTLPHFPTDRRRKDYRPSSTTDPIETVGVSLLMPFRIHIAFRKLREKEDWLRSDPDLDLNHLHHYGSRLQPQPPKNAFQPDSNTSPWSSRLRPRKNGKYFPSPLSREL